MPPARALAVLSGAFALFATLNAGGYRYGVGDQAFYIPAILRHLDGRLFPRDAALIDSQARLFVLDELLAGLVAATGIDLPVWFLAGYALTLALLFVALVLVARSIVATPWTIAAFLAAAALKHRIAKTGANTLEGYFHPRQLAFAAGLLGVAFVLRRRPIAAMGLVVAAGVVHPTTAVWFGLWVGVAVIVNEPGLRRPLLAVGAGAAGAGLAIVASGWLSLAPMDAAWLATLADKDYVFPTQWAIDTWLLNLAYPVVLAGTFVARQRRGLARDGESGVVAGALALVILFLGSLPLIAARIALAVQLQVSRVFWMTDVLAVLYVVWWACEARPTSTPAARSRGWPAATTRAALVAALLWLVAAGRGWTVWRVEHPGRPAVAATLPDDAWRDVTAWLRRSPIDSHVLADPGHAWRYGSSLRVAAHRDVWLEDVKDGSIGMYDRGVAMRVAERRAAAPDFAALPPEALRALAARYDLDYLVSERPVALPETYRNPRFYVYRLQP
jgi:hypothetical protein